MWVGRVLAGGNRETHLSFQSHLYSCSVPVKSKLYEDLLSYEILIEHPFQSPIFIHLSCAHYHI